MRFLIKLLLLLGLGAGVAAAQGLPYQITNMPGTSFQVCSFPVSGNPCSNLATIYTTAAESTVLPQPVTFPTGNGTFYISAGTYTIQFSGATTQSITVTLGGGSSLPSSLGTSGTFIIAPACSAAATNCLALVDDDSTDNCLNSSLSTFMAAINNYSGPGMAQLIIQGSGLVKAYLFQTCQLKFTGSGGFGVSVHSFATLDAGTNSSANLVQVGAGAGTPSVFLWDGGTFTGGADLTVAGIEVTNSTGNTILDHIQWINFGAGNATLGSCTNYAVNFDNFVFEATITHNTWAVTDSTTGRCAFNNADTQVGSATVYYIANTLGGKSGASCASILIGDQGYYGVVDGNNLGNAAIDINARGNGHRIVNNQLDSEGCTANGVNAAIQVTGTVPDVTVANNTGQFGTGHLTNLIEMAGNGASGFQSWTVTGNSQSETTSTSAQLIGGNNNTCSATVTAIRIIGCHVAGNQDLLPPFPCGTGNGSFAGWQVGADVGACSATTSDANISATTIYTQFSANTYTRVSCQVVLTTADSTSSTLPQCQVVYTDALSNATQTITLTPVWASGTVGCNGTTTNTVGNSCTGSAFIEAKVSTVVQFQTINYASGGTTHMAAKVNAEAENAYVQ